MLNQPHQVVEQPEAKGVVAVATSGIHLHADAWDEIRGTAAELELPQLAEVSGMEAVTSWLDERGLGWHVHLPAVLGGCCAAERQAAC